MKTIGEPSKPYPNDLNRALLGQNFLPYLLETEKLAALQRKVTRFQKRTQLAPAI